MANKTNPFIALAIVLLGVVFGWFYYSQFIRDYIEQPPVSPVKSGDNLLEFGSLPVSFELFNDQTFKALTIFGEAPVKADNPGKDVPFN